MLRERSASLSDQVLGAASICPRLPQASKASNHHPTTAGNCASACDHHAALERTGLSELQGHANLAKI
jgi:hypothetical protein